MHKNDIFVHLHLMFLGNSRLFCSEEKKGKGDRSFRALIGTDTPGDTPLLCLKQTTC